MGVCFPGAKPQFYSPEVGGPLDLSVPDFYPKRGDVRPVLKALHVYELGKPLVVEEIYPLNCTNEEAAQFINRSRQFVDGWFSFYWGETIEELRPRSDLEHQIQANWLELFSSRAKQRGMGPSATGAASF